MMKRRFAGFPRRQFEPTSNGARVGVHQVDMRAIFGLAALPLGIFPPMEERKAAAARIDQMRAETARLFGVQDVTLDAVRESRNRP